MNVNDLVEQAKKDESLHSNIDVDELLQKSDTPYLSIEAILKTNMDAVSYTHLTLPTILLV